MADWTASYAVHKTLTANAVDNVVLSSNKSDYVEVSNYDASADLRVTTDGTAPAVAATTDVYLIKPGTTKLINSGGGTDYVKLISSGAVAYSVQGAQ